MDCRSQATACSTHLEILGRYLEYAYGGAHHEAVIDREMQAI